MMPKSIAAFPRLLRAATDASRMVFGQIPVTLSGSSLAQAMAGRRSLHASPNLSPADHQQRVGELLARLLRDPGARRDLRALLDSYGDHPSSVEDPWHVGELPGDDGTVIRDENGLTVCTAPSAEAAHELVKQHNREA